MKKPAYIFIIFLLVPKGKNQPKNIIDLTFKQDLTQHMIPVKVVTCPSLVDMARYHMVPIHVETQEHYS